VARHVLATVLAKVHHVIMEVTMINWPEMLRYADDWANGFLAGAATISLIGIAGVAFVLLVHPI
jgi:hypothetical protein